MLLLASNFVSQVEWSLGVCRGQQLLGGNGATDASLLLRYEIVMIAMLAARIFQSSLKL